MKPRKKPEPWGDEIWSWGPPNPVTWLIVTTLYGETGSMDFEGDDKIGFWMYCQENNGRFKYEAGEF